MKIIAMVKFAFNIDDNDEDVKGKTLEEIKNFFYESALGSSEDGYKAEVLDFQITKGD